MPICVGIQANGDLAFGPPGISILHVSEPARVPRSGQKISRAFDDAFRQHPTGSTAGNQQPTTWQLGPTRRFPRVFIWCREIGQSDHLASLVAPLVRTLARAQRSTPACKTGLDQLNALAISSTTRDYAGVRNRVTAELQVPSRSATALLVKGTPWILRHAAVGPPLIRLPVGYDGDHPNHHTCCQRQYRVSMGLLLDLWKEMGGTDVHQRSRGHAQKTA